MVNGIIITSTAVEDKIYSSGTLLSYDEVEIRNEIPGKITALVFREGTKVKKGELLVKLYDDDINAQLKKLLSQKDIAEKTEGDLITLFELREGAVQTPEAISEQITNDLRKIRFLLGRVGRNLQFLTTNDEK